MKKRIMIIPAKGISTRIKNKNIKKFYNKPIISYALSNAKKSNLFQKIHVSTESKKVKRIVEKLGYKVDFLRPKSLAKNNTPTIDVLRYVIKQYLKLDKKFDEIWTMYCCTPLLKPGDLVKASKVLKKNKVLLSVTKFDVPTEWSFTKLRNGNLKPSFPKKIFSNSKKFKEKYHDAGAFAVFPHSMFIERNIDLENNFTAFVLPRQRALDIDNMDDWKLAEELYKIK